MTFYHGFQNFSVLVMVPFRDSLVPEAPILPTSLLQCYRSLSPSLATPQLISMLVNIDNFYNSLNRCLGFLTLASLSLSPHVVFFVRSCTWSFTVVGRQPPVSMFLAFMILMTYVHLFLTARRTGYYELWALSQTLVKLWTSRSQKHEYRSWQDLMSCSP